MTAPGADPRPRAWGLRDVVLMFALWLLVALGGLGVLVLLPEGVATDPWVVVALVVLPWPVLLGWPLLVTARRGRGPVRELRLRCTWRQARVGVLGGLVAMVCALVVAGVTAEVTGEVPTSAAGDVVGDLLAGGLAPVVVLAVLAVVGAPLVEEVAFRGLLYGALEKAGRSAVTCVLVSSVAFALFHFEPERMPLLLVSGVVLGVVRARTGSTGAAVVAHVVNNVPSGIGLVVLAVSQQ